MMPLPVLGQSVTAIDNLLKSSDLSYDHEDYDLSIDQAEKAYDLAAQTDDQLRMAKALQNEAKALIAKPKKVKANRRKAQEKLDESLTLLTDDQYRLWRIESLKSLKLLAELNKDVASALSYQQQINEINSLIAKTKAEKKLKAKSNLLEAKAEALAEEAELLEEKTEELVEEKTSLSHKVETLVVDKAQLRRKVKTLNQAQLESELLIALEKNRADSLAFEAQLDALALAQNEMQLAEQKSKMDLQSSELEIQKSKRNMYLAFLGLFGIGGMALLLRFRGINKHNKELQLKNEIIETERAKSEKLLLNILPSVVADELKINGTAKARRYETATVLFTDFVNFTSISKNMTAEKLVSKLDHYFKMFDDIITSHNLEKIKTIGDAYMCVGGLPNANMGTPADVVNAALELQRLIQSEKAKAEAKGEIFFEARIGVHTGPLVAGVVGSKKFAFDIWGDTVNIASRIETGGLPGKVNISGATYKEVKEYFRCESRGVLPIKNIGKIEMYFVKGVA